MTTQREYLEFAPPPTRGLLGGLGLAIIAHGFLVALLAVGVHWKREATLVTAEAELWSAIPQEAAPPPPPPELPPEVQSEPVKPPPEPVVEPPAPVPDPAIAIERERTKLQKERLKREQLDKEKKQKDKLLAEKLEKEKALKDKALKDKAARDKAQESTIDAAKLKKIREDQLKRMAGLAAGSGDAGSTGTAAKSSGPSAGYAGRIRARIKPNITFTDTISGNPTAEVEVRTSPDGTIISRKLLQGSGVKSWDDAVLAAIDKTEVLPRDVDGHVPPALVISFRPRD